MSAGYAERLSAYPNKGKCGLPENYDTSRSLSSKISILAQLLTQSSYTVVLTGAGISTSAGIPDFRGPNGIWTREQGKKMKTSNKKKKRKRSNNDDPLEQTTNSDGQDEEERQTKSPSFVTAKPTLTHRALAHLITTKTTTTDPKQHSRYYLQHLITQNIDGLHGKTSLPRSKLSILHGDIFTEKCSKCHQEYIRKFEITTIGLQPTGRYCTNSLVAPPPPLPTGGESPNNDGATASCNGVLIDTLLDWEDALPDLEWNTSQIECAKAELILCLGTSLRIEPAGGLCQLGTTVGYVEAGAADWNLDLGDERNNDDDDDATTKKKKRGSSSSSSSSRKKKKKRQPQPKKLGYVIVNLQETPYDENATLVIRARVDDVMERLMIKLGYGDDWDSK
ncbi:hypothetical protein ACHAXM_001995 [Skeletonema potamos]